MDVESPAQILSPASLAERIAIDYATPGDPPRTLYMVEGQGTTLGPAVVVEPLDSEERQARARTARAELRGDEFHRRWCGRGALTYVERASCGTCALLGWTDPRDDEAPTDAPNNVGWPLVYVAARRPIPRVWLAAFVRELNTSDNDRYRDYLRRHVATFGYRLTDDAPSLQLRTPTPESVREYIEEMQTDDPREVIEALKAIVKDDDYDTATQRAAFRAFNRVVAPVDA